MSRIVDFVMRLSEDIYQAKLEHIHQWHDVHDNSTEDTLDTEPATSIESIK